MTYTVWLDLGNVMAAQNYQKYYFTPESYKAENPLEALVVPPGIEQFFGTRVLNLFIVGKPYGWSKQGGTWTQNWPPSGLQDAIDRHIRHYDKFTAYRTVFFMDMNLVNLITADSPGSRFGEMMTAVRNRLTSVCSQLSNYGFEMGPDITSQVGPEFFQPYIDPHFLINRA